MKLALVALITAASLATGCQAVKSFCPLIGSPEFCDALDESGVRPTEAD